MPIPEDERRTDKRPGHERIDHERIDELRVDDRQICDPPIDEKFESHLKQFRPLAPQPLPAASRVHAPQRWFVLAAWAATAAAVVAVAVLTYHARSGRPAPPVETFTIADQLVKSQSLTIRTANALLATAPSFKDAIDGMAFPPKPAPLPVDRHSALAELSKEKIKL
ncbi:MAG: hypothetical protein WAN60_07320 [Candidatus Sulfotelmatobacter sp.]